MLNFYLKTFLILPSLPPSYFNPPYSPYIMLKLMCFEAGAYTHMYALERWSCTVCVKKVMVFTQLPATF